jgi:hypothetical protein
MEDSMISLMSNSANAVALQREIAIREVIMMHMVMALGGRFDFTMDRHDISNAADYVQTEPARLVLLNENADGSLFLECNVR